MLSLMSRTTLYPLLSRSLAASALAGASQAALIVLGLLGAIPASDLAIAIVNASVSDVVGARRLARLSLAEGEQQPVTHRVTQGFELRRRGDPGQLGQHPAWRRQTDSPHDTQ